MNQLLNHNKHAYKGNNKKRLEQTTVKELDCKARVKAWFKSYSKESIASGKSLTLKRPKLDREWILSLGKRLLLFGIECKTEELFEWKKRGKTLGKTRWGPVVSRKITGCEWNNTGMRGMPRSCCNYNYCNNNFTNWKFPSSRSVM